MQRLTVGEIVFVRLWHIRTFFGTYEQFIRVLWNVFLIGNVRKSETGPRDPHIFTVDKPALTKPQRCIFRP